MELSGRGQFPTTLNNFSAFYLDFLGINNIIRIQQQTTSNLNIQLSFDIRVASDISDILQKKHELCIQHVALQRCNLLIDST